MIRARKIPGRALAPAIAIAAAAAMFAPATAGAAVVPVHLTARPAVIHPAPGVRMKAWTFNGSVPAPTIRVTEGDTVQVTLKNADWHCKKVKGKKKHGKHVKRRGRRAGPSHPGRSAHVRRSRARHRGERRRARRADRSARKGKCKKGKRRVPGMYHSLDFHAAQIAPNVGFKSIPPGKSHTFSFVARHPGVYIYHCGTAPMLEHIGMGMFGMIIVDPVVPRPPATEIMLVQNEFYGKVRNGWLHSTYRAMQTENPRFYSFNGNSQKYMRHPIEVPVGEPVRIYLVDAGPNFASAFHVIGNVFTTFEHDGDPSEPIHDVSVQTVPPGGAGIFELTFPEAGSYPFLSHAARAADAGAMGMFMAK